MLAVSACKRSEQTAETTTTEPQKTEAPKPKSPSFSGDSAYANVAKQVAFGPRVPNTPAHRKCGDWMVAELKRRGAKVIEQPFREAAFTGQMLDLRNIMASFNPKATKRILLASHWDSRPFADKDTARQKEAIDGASDGGSGVGVLLEIARILSDTAKLPNVGVDLLFFDGEDYGWDGENTSKLGLKAVDSTETWCLGSQYWSRNRVPAGYTAAYGILLDMVGAKNARIAKEGQSVAYAPQVVEKVWSTAARLGYTDYFILYNADGITDDHQYVNQGAGIPMIDLTEYNTAGTTYFPAYHHTHKDSMPIIDKNTLKAVGQTVLEVIYSE
jgi:glutaminyl-peptide cyclotransferase